MGRESRHRGRQPEGESETRRIGLLLSEVARTRGSVVFGSTLPMRPDLAEQGVPDIHVSRARSARSSALDPSKPKARPTGPRLDEPS